jgi:hypothetical protein
MPDQLSVRVRLQRLEARQRCTHLVAGAGLALLLAAMSGPPQEAAAPREVVEAGEVRVVRDGKVRIRLGVDEAGAASIELLDPSGTRRAALTAPVGAAARVLLFDADGEPQPLIGQLAGEAEALGRRAAADLQHEFEAAVGGEAARLHATLTALLAQLGERAAEPAEADRPLLELRIVARPGDPGLDLAEEVRRLRAWIAASPAARTELHAIEAFHALPARAGGRLSDRLRWVPHLILPSTAEPGRRQARLTPAIDAVVPAFDDEAWNDGRVKRGAMRLIEYVPVRTDLGAFTEADLDPDQVAPGLDEAGRPALRYAMRAERQQAFADWSEAHLQRHSAILIDGTVVTAPLFVSKISGAAMITGDFTPEQVEALAQRMRGERR